MRIKRYVVNQLPEAMPMIRKDLGANALILDTKKINTGGFLGLFKKQKLEVIAALDPVKMEQDHKEKVAAALKQEKALRAQDSRKDSVKGQSDNPDIVNEIKSIKQFLFEMMETEQLPESLKQLNNLLEEQNLTKSIRSNLLAVMAEKMKEKPGLSTEAILTIARQELLHRLKSLPVTSLDPKAKMVCFVGPTGVGKTTTIAKIAAEYLLNQQKKVGLITSDTYRIAAVEQLRTYAKILGIPLEVIHSTEELKKAVSKLEECDVILMDTAGRNYQQKKYIHDLEQLLNEQDAIQVNLVISLTAKYEDMRDVAKNFQPVGVDQLIFTKRDETKSYGSILNLIDEFDMPLSYITNGQNVPDDITVATPELIVDLILGEDGHDRSSESIT
ncbi:flagellar biosynthesis protein FlhF [Pseudalkalibacillus caeni]|uniref:Flagellar biosynthesis protein FlhF n=1 Tax=Exobacillus caeni TaxID=2574798 RepID=A0A5R9F4S6_9BACL|nr:flagellar biosynthesis protein FlhF [Pseudalkalibacillus caeni]TLS36648.1 flagellar biosynthesis protein FlhF [Pseudalkalibacillus caeni]